MTTYNYVAAPTTEDNIEAAKVEIDFLRGVVSELKDKVNEVANKNLRLTEGIQQQLKILVEEDTLELYAANTILDTLGIDRIKIVKEYEVTLSGSWYVTVTLEAEDEESAIEMAESIDVDLEVTNLEHNMSVHADDIETTDVSAEEA